MDEKCLMMEAVGRDCMEVAQSRYKTNLYVLCQEGFNAIALGDNALSQFMQCLRVRIFVLIFCLS